MNKVLCINNPCERLARCVDSRNETTEKRKHLYSILKKRD